MAIENYQMSYDGVTFGLGTDIGIESIEGFEDFDTNMADSPVPREWGDIPGLHTVASKEVVLELTARTDADLAVILATFQPVADAKPLTLREPHGGFERFLWARPVGRIVPKNPGTKFKRMVTVRLKAADPRLYSADALAGTATVYTAATGGLDYGALNYGKEYVGAASTGDAIVANDGTSLAYPTIRIFGPQDGGTLTGATVTNRTTGKTAEFVFTSGLLAADIFTADMRRIVTGAGGSEPYIALGGVNRYGNWQLPREPFYLVPGENVIRYEVAGTTTDSTCVLVYRHTSL